MQHSLSSRLLIVDDNERIHDDIRKILEHDRQLSELDEATALMLGTPVKESTLPTIEFEIDSATQGQDGVALVRDAVRAERPYAIAFVDMRMPPGWDGLETIERIWQEDSNIQTVICTAFSDYSWEQITERLGATDRLLILRKPFDMVAARQLAYSLAWKWTIGDQVRTRLEVLTRQKNEFLANMSHELRTPLHGILSFARFGLTRYQKVGPEKLRSYFEQIESSGNTLLSLVNDLLDLAKLESGKMTIEPERTHVGQMIRGIADEFRSMLRERKLELVIRGCDIDVFGGIDGARIKQVIRNLVANATKFSPEGGRIELAAACEDDSLLVSVRDEGPGVPPAELRSVFEKFYQSSNTDHSSGTGLGLAISQQIVEAHRGRIWLENNSDRGAKFSFKIPLHLELHRTRLELDEAS